MVVYLGNYKFFLCFVLFSFHFSYIKDASNRILCDGSHCDAHCLASCKLELFQNCSYAKQQYNEPDRAGNLY